MRQNTRYYIGGVSRQRQSRFEQATRSLAMFVRSHRSFRSFAPQRSASLVHGLAHSLCSLPRGTVEILEYVFTLLLCFTRKNAFLALTRNTPILWWTRLVPDKCEPDFFLLLPIPRKVRRKRSIFVCVAAFVEKDQQILNSVWIWTINTSENWLIRDYVIKGGGGRRFRYDESMKLVCFFRIVIHKQKPLLYRCRWVYGLLLHPKW